MHCFLVEHEIIHFYFKIIFEERWQKYSFLRNSRDFRSLGAQISYRKPFLSRNVLIYYLCS